MSCTPAIPDCDTATIPTLPLKRFLAVLVTAFCSRRQDLTARTHELLSPICHCISTPFCSNSSTAWSVAGRGCTSVSTCWAALPHPSKVGLLALSTCVVAKTDHTKKNGGWEQKGRGKAQPRCSPIHGEVDRPAIELASWDGNSGVLQEAFESDAGVRHALDLRFQLEKRLKL
jgi:hypothetical protein